MINSYIFPHASDITGVYIRPRWYQDLMPTNVPLRTVERAFDVVEFLWRRHGASVTDVTREFDMPKSTAHDYLRTLALTGYAINEGGEYRLSTKFLQIGGRLKYRMGIFHAARPELQRIAEETGETANITIEEDGQAVIMHCEREEGALNLGEYPGLHTPLHSHASGKAILSMLPEERVQRIIDRHGLPEITKHTTTNEDSLFEQLETIREQGYAIDTDEQVTGMGVVAAPLTGLSEIPAALGIVCPTHGLQDDEYAAELAEIARQSANMVAINATYSD